ncbi:AHH domain-containing protein [Marinicellulosiphila megalodicopiae]|uniref:AHH domain-containing protein n=1 Tax=Marinicellulosiphila megalodicopiae TaxID=2724896 RepID=UPI003BB1C284
MAPTLEHQLKLSGNAQRWLLRENIGIDNLPLGNVAHHSIPLESIKEMPELMSKAAKGGFDINGKNNGFSLSNEVHGSNISNHPVYNQTVLEQLRTIDVNAKPSLIALEMQKISDALNDAMRNGSFLPRG